MDLQLTKKIALVTGSTAGIGNAIAASLAREGATVIVSGRSAAAVDAAVSSMKAATRGDVLGFAGDLSVAAVAESLFQRHPAVDILVNNLGIFEVRPFEEIADADWQRFFDVNVLSGARLARLYLPAMRQRNWGRIIFISSESGYHIPAEMIHYGMTKAAQIAVARGLAETTAGTGHYREQRAAGAHALARRGRFRGRNGGQIRSERAGRGAGILQEGTSHLTAAAVRDPGRSCGDGDIRREPVVFRNQRCRATRRWGHDQERVLIARAAG